MDYDMDNTLDFLRTASLAMIFLFIGLNIAIWKHHYEDRDRLVYLGRFGISASLIVLIGPRLVNYTIPALVFYIILIPSMASYTLGLLHFYKKKSKQEDINGG